MSLLSSYRNNAQHKRKEISNIISQNATEKKKLSDISSKMQRASQTLNQTTNISTIRSKSHEIERHQKQSVRIEKKIADNETKISHKKKQLDDLQNKIHREEQREFDKRKKEEEKRARKLNNTIIDHERKLNQTISDIKEIKSIPEEITVLFFASNPIDQKQLRLDEEVRDIQEMIRKTKHRDSVNLESCWAVRPGDVIQSINEKSPAIVHFSGHGSNRDEIILQDERGETKKVSKEAIVQSMMSCSESIRLIFFNTCYSHGQAKAVVQHVEAAIGMGSGISDNAARFFSSQFYSSLGFGHSLKKAFDQAVARLMLEGIPEENIPELYVHEGFNPDEIVIVKPNSVL